MNLDGKRILVTGGTGSLGRAVVRRLLTMKPEAITVFSRDEAKQHEMRLEYLEQLHHTDEVIYAAAQKTLRLAIGDVRDYASVCGALREVDLVIHAAALKQVPTCEYVPWEAVQTNVIGAYNICRAIREGGLPIEAVVGVSTDKAVKPVNTMGMTKALQERLLICENLVSKTRFACVRYGNVLDSRGSVVPLFRQQIEAGGPVTITDPIMTRFLLTLDEAAQAVLSTLCCAGAGETWVPKLPSVRILDLARAIIGSKQIQVTITTIRPGEKIHEILVSEEERARLAELDNFYVIQPILPELRRDRLLPASLDDEYSSADHVLKGDLLLECLRQKGVIAHEEVAA